MEGNRAVNWRKSSYSGNSRRQCVEVGIAAPLIAVRDSKDPGGPASPSDVKHGKLSPGRLRLTRTSR